LAWFLSAKPFLGGQVTPVSFALLFTRRKIF
jgi:hypothetical protein